MAKLENTPDVEVHSPGWSRRTFLRQATALVGSAVVAPHLMAQKAALTAAEGATPAPSGMLDVALKVNGAEHTARIEPCVTLLDTLRDRLELTGTKKGCDHGTCGACTVHVDRKRVLSCLTLAVSVQGKEITTIEGLAHGDQLHPLQEAFIDCDGFQCGFCTPGQIMSGVACIQEGHVKSDDEIREWMSGNLCRCSAYPNILDAVKKAAGIAAAPRAST